MLIETMPEVLTWSESKDVLGRIHKSYLELLGQRLGEALARIQLIDSKSATAVVDQLREIPESSFERLVTAPETSYRVLWPGQHSLRDVATFLMDAIEAEQLRSIGGIPSKSSLWTALGDIQFSTSGEIFRAPVLNHPLTVDFVSPYAMDLDLNGMMDVTDEPRAPYNSEEQLLILGRLNRALRAIRATDPEILKFALLFTKVLILQRDPTVPDSFSSGSSGQYVGRSVLANPHLGEIDEVEIAEGIIHEAIHSALYMQEQQKSWVTDPILYGPTPRTVSPWTGNLLPLRPYLQASFVWYGLLHFWSVALQQRTFDTRRIQSKLSGAAKGFLGKPMLNQITAHLAFIDPALLESVARMQTRVTEIFMEVIA